MKKIIALLLVVILLAACNNNDKTPDNALDTGRAFIRASLNGDFDKATNFILQDSTNTQLFDSYKVFYKKLPEKEKDGYKSSDYNIIKYQDVSDSVTLIQYSNTFMNKPMELKIVRPGDTWLVDFKYSYSGN
jgi:hypothetical protein